MLGLYYQNMFKEILVIDDNPDIRFLICNILEEQNFKVRSAANYDQAIMEIEKRLPDLAIIDIKLDKPDKDGIDLLKFINLKNKLMGKGTWWTWFIMSIAPEVDSFLAIWNNLKNLLIIIFSIQSG